MPESLSTSLAAAASETFESLAYLFAEDAVPATSVATAADGVVAVAFSGASHGGGVLQLSGGILPALAANMLGVDEATSVPEQQDALGEVANVICGNVLPRVAGTAAVFALGIPQRHADWASAVATLGAVSAQVRLELDGGRADVALVLHPDA
jgi:hypothetical protein